MRVAILLFDQLAVQDAIGPYEVMRCVSGWDVGLVGPRRGGVRAEGGLGLSVDRSLEEVTEPGIVVVPGGEGSEAVAEDEATLDWLRAADERTTWHTSA